MPLPPSNLGRRFLRLALAVLSLGLPLVSSAQVMNPTKPPEAKKPAPIEGTATWYSVPPNSLARRRTGKELTAAHIRLPIGTKVRVTHLGNKKNVIVRITDRLVSKRNVIIDLSKEAAEQMDMIREGSARVRLEILPDDKLPESKKTKTPAW